MAITYEEFMAKTGAEKVAGQLILGKVGSRFIAGTRKNGVFSLTPEGEEYLATLDQPVAVQEKPKRGRKKKEVVEDVLVDEDFEALLAEGD